MQTPKNYDHLFKILIVGDENVGKTTFLHAFSHKLPIRDEYYATIGIDFQLRTLKCANGKLAKMQVWDTAGADRFRTITKAYYKGAMAFIICIDINNENCVERLKYWLCQIENDSDRLVYVAFIDRRPKSPGTYIDKATLYCRENKLPSYHITGIEDVIQSGKSADEVLAEQSTKLFMDLANQLCDKAISYVIPERLDNITSETLEDKIERLIDLMEGKTHISQERLAKYVTLAEKNMELKYLLKMTEDRRQEIINLQAIQKEDEEHMVALSKEVESINSSIKYSCF